MAYTAFRLPVQGINQPAPNRVPRLERCADVHGGRYPAFVLSNRGLSHANDQHTTRKVASAVCTSRQKPVNNDNLPAFQQGGPDALEPPLGPTLSLTENRACPIFSDGMMRT